MERNSMSKLCCNSKPLLEESACGRFTAITLHAGPAAAATVSKYYYYNNNSKAVLDLLLFVFIDSTTRAKPLRLIVFSTSEFNILSTTPIELV